MLGIAASSKRPHLTAFTLFAVWFLTMPSVSRAQVVIEERAEIGVSESASQKTGATTAIDIVPGSDGFLCGYYSTVERLVNPLPLNNGIVTVVKNSASFAVDTVRTRLSIETATSVAACGQTVLTRYSYSAATSDERWWTIGSIEESDQIQVSYQSDRGLLPTTINEQIPGAVWVAKMGDQCSGYTNYLEYVLLSLAIVDPDTTLTISSSESTVWPDNLEKGVPSWFSTSFADPVVDEVAIRLFDGCAPMAEHEVSVRAEWVDGSGGHLHGESQDSLPYFGSMGRFTVLTDTTRSALATITDTTGPDGFLRLSYLAPEFGGSVDIIAEATVGTEVMVDTFHLDVKVPDLKALPDTVGDALIGGRCNHYGPRDDAAFPNCRTPDDNHYATQSTIDKLVAISARWSAVSPTQPFKINDISLPFGGRFDICGEWSACKKGHKFHRMGRDADVRTSRDSTSAAGVFVKTLGTYVEGTKTKPIVRNDDFDKVTWHVTGIKPEVHSKGDVNNEHYHLYFYK